MNMMLLSLARQEEMCSLAMAAIHHYCDERPSAPSLELGRLQELVIKRAATGTLDDWRDVLDAALSDAGYAVYWRGNEVFEVVGWA